MVAPEKTRCKHGGITNRFLCVSNYIVWTTIGGTPKGYHALSAVRVVEKMRPRRGPEKWLFMIYLFIQFW